MAFGRFRVSQGNFYKEEVTDPSPESPANYYTFGPVAQLG